MEWTDDEVNQLVELLKKELALDIDYDIALHMVKWENIEISGRSMQECKDKALLLINDARKKRFLSEIIVELNGSAHVDKINSRKPPSPATLYATAKLESVMARNPGISKNYIFKSLKAEFPDLKSKNKGKYLLESARKHIQQNTPIPFKKEVIKYLEQHRGRPCETKMYRSGFTLFSSKLKLIPGSNRAKTVADTWNNLPPDQKEDYKNQAKKYMEDLFLEYDKYISSLDAFEKTLEKQICNSVFLSRF